jgi:hypothetical protein
MATIKITIPDLLAEQAESMGLLRDEVIVSLLTDAVRLAKVNDLFVAADRLADLDLPAMSADEVQAEIAAARADRRAGRS